MRKMHFYPAAVAFVLAATKRSSVHPLLRAAGFSPGSNAADR
jgi:hypothetical protein